MGKENFTAYAWLAALIVTGLSAMEAPSPTFFCLIDDHETATDELAFDDNNTIPSPVPISAPIPTKQEEMSLEHIQLNCYCNPLITLAPQNVQEHLQSTEHLTFSFLREMGGKRQLGYTAWEEELPKIADRIIALKNNPDGLLYLMRNCFPRLHPDMQKAYGDPRYGTTLPDNINALAIDIMRSNLIATGKFPFLLNATMTETSEPAYSQFQRRYPHRLHNAHTTDNKETLHQQGLITELPLELPLNITINDPNDTSCSQEGKKTKKDITAKFAHEIIRSTEHEAEVFLYFHSYAASRAIQNSGRKIIYRCPIKNCAAKDKIYTTMTTHCGVQIRIQCFISPCNSSIPLSLLSEHLERVHFNPQLISEKERILWRIFSEPPSKKDTLYLISNYLNSAIDPHIRKTIFGQIERGKPAIKQIAAKLKKYFDCIFLEEGPTIIFKAKSTAIPAVSSQPT